MDPDADFLVNEEQLLELNDQVPGATSDRFTEPFAEFRAKEGSVGSGSVYTDSEAESKPSVSEDEDDGHVLKRPAEDDAAPRPFKRQKGILNMDYLDLLNRDIEDAVHRVCLADEVDVEPSQIGLTYWSSLEKKLFFEALARLGRDDLPGIASRIGTKSVVEVKHYLGFLEDAQRSRRADGLRPVVEFAEYPAAVELSQQCCHALEEAADALSVRQERREEQREESKWGECWDITPRIAVRFEKGELSAESQQFPAAHFLNLQNWLQLSKRIFMNSSIPGDNWNFIDDHPPSIWATTFEDFHSLAASITRRLVHATIFMSMSRIRAKKELVPRTRDVIRKKDVEAAVASLGMSHNSHEFWRKCARRLRLEVYEEPPDRNEDGEEEALGFEEVEQALRRDGDTGPSVEAEPVTDTEEQESELEELPTDEESANESDDEQVWTLSDEEEYQVNLEANEVLHFSAADFPETYRTKESLKIRIATERQQEEYAENCDQCASTQAEAEMWEIIQRPPPMELPKMQDPGQQPRSKMDVESIYPIWQNWRKMRYQSEWESKAGAAA